jgi:hypothetical protein
MRTSVASDLDFLVNHWAEESKVLDSDAFTAFSQGLASLFKVKANEVAVLAIAGRGHFLRFVVPEKLQVVGTIPLNSTTALVARTARERRPDIQNAFAGFRHASVFEGVPLEEGQCEMIQKIMSVPILEGKEVVGVVQISRKGHSQHEAGPDFGPSDLRTLQALAPTLARFILLAKKD